MSIEGQFLRYLRLQILSLQRYFQVYNKSKIRLNSNIKLLLFGLILVLVHHICIHYSHTCIISALDNDTLAFSNISFPGSGKNRLAKIQHNNMNHFVLTCLETHPIIEIILGTFSLLCG